MSGTAVANKRGRLGKCKHCGVTYSNKKDYWEHKRTHIKPDQLLVCSLCDFVTNKKRYLKYHMLRHENIKPYSCNECTAGFFSINSLNSHLKVHSAIYKYRCHHCPFETRYLAVFKRHVRAKRHDQELRSGFGTRPLAAKPATAVEPSTSATLENFADQAAAETHNSIATATLLSSDAALQLLAGVALQSSRLPTNEERGKGSTPLQQPKVLTGGPSEASATARKPVRKNARAPDQRQQKLPEKKVQTISASCLPPVQQTKTIEAILHVAQSNQNPCPLIERPVDTTEHSSADDRFSGLMLLATEATKAARLPLDEAGQQSSSGVNATPLRPVEKTTDRPLIRVQGVLPTRRWGSDARFCQVQIGPVTAVGRVRVLMNPAAKNNYSEGAAKNYSEGEAAAVMRVPRFTAYRPSVHRTRVYAQRGPPPSQCSRKAVRTPGPPRQPAHYVSIPRPFYVCRQCDMEAPGRYGYVSNVSNNSRNSDVLTCTRCGQPLTGLCSFTAQSAFEPDRS